jgi:hypothetical protein
MGHRHPDPRRAGQYPQRREPIPPPHTWVFFTTAFTPLYAQNLALLSLILEQAEKTSVTIATMFHVRCIFPEQGRIEANSFELKPTNSQGEAVCDLFHRFLADRPPEFRDRLPFLRRGDIELDWSAAAGGVALASLFCSGGPAAISVLLSGIDEQADAMMSEVFRENVLEVLFSGQFEEALEVPDRPLVIQVLFPTDPEWMPAIQLLSAALASVYFRSLLEDQ